MSLLLMVAVPFVLSTAAPLLWRIPLALRTWVLALAPASAFVWLLTLDGAVGHAEFGWVTQLGVSFALGLDGLSRLFALLVTGIGAAVLAYTSSYFGNKREGTWFTAAIYAFMGSMLGAVTATNVLTLFIFWELTSLASFALIGFRYREAAARDSALQALFVTSAGGLALLAGLVLWGSVAGGYHFSHLLASDVRGHPWYPAVFGLVLLGAATKSAQVPFHFWLPNAMAAPTPASAYLHSATMVKLGVYLLARFSPALGGTELWSAAVGSVGGITVVLAAALALTTTDAKRVLAYTTVGALGAMILLLGLDTTEAAEAAAAFVFAHAIYKAPLFLAVGAIEHESGTRDLTRLRGLGRRMPATFAVTVFAAVAMAGIPPTFAFLAKESALEAARGASWNLLPFASLTAGGIGFAAAAAILATRPWLGRASREATARHEAPAGLWAPAMLLAGAGLVAGLLHEETANRLVAPATEAISGHFIAMKLEFWHGWSPTVAVTLSSFVVGAVAAACWSHLRPALAAAAAALGPARPEGWYAAALAAVRMSSGLTIRTFQHGRLRGYIATSLCAGLALASVPVLQSHDAVPSFPPADWRAYELAIAGLIIVAALGAAATRDRIFAIACLGAVGLGTALVYVMFSAPDLALTQLLVDTLAVIVLVLAYYHFPRALPKPPRVLVLRDMLIAAAVGGFVTFLLLSASATRTPDRVSATFAERSLSEGFGRNVVNVILVDFRALDTLGEVAVLATAALGVYGLLRLRRARQDT